MGVVFEDVHWAIDIGDVYFVVGGDAGFEEFLAGFVEDGCGFEIGLRNFEGADGGAWGEVAEFAGDEVGKFDEPDCYLGVARIYEHGWVKILT